MKKIIALALVLTTLAATAFSNPSPSVGKLALNSFNSNYAAAKDVQWESLGYYTKVGFVLDGQKMYAYYRENGEQFALTRNILSTQLPLELATDLKALAKNRWITELFEISTNGETSYFATLTSADHITVLKADASGYWSVFKKRKVKND